jgi:hypothetical protein
MTYSIDTTIGPDMVEEFTQIMREADEIFHTSGGSTRHYVRDVLLPLMQKKGIYLCKLNTQLCEPTILPASPTGTI